MTRLRSRRACLALMALGPALPARAQTGKPIRLLVPFPPGGATDITARVIAEPLGRLLGAPVIVENRAGAGGSVGMAEAARAAPDGTTLAMATLSTHGVNPAVYRKLPYDPVRDFVAVTELVRAPGVLVVNPSLPARDLAQFIAYLKANPGKLNYSSPGNGTIGHMWGELFRSSTGTTITHVAYKGAADALRDTIGGNVQASFDQVASSLPHIQAGKLRALAISSERRLDMLPEVPTFREAGLPSNNEPSWFGLVAPAGTPAPVVARIQAAAAAAVREPAVTARLLDLALFPSGSTPQSFAAQIRDEIAKMKKVAEFAGITLD
ncbi:MAG: tripartite tricarboxylate transporter substrate binding protein BugE [Pseudomonadota bacterium]|jgi:tripartite-type tricarboxylate transporter receptor subunit TctC